MALQDVSTSPEWLELTLTAPRVSADELYAYWVEPERLTSWWPQRAELDVREGGDCVLGWPAMSWTLRGRYLTVVPGERLAFTWSWDHEGDDVPEREVHLDFSDSDDGARLSIRHGPYGSEASEREERDGHREGWSHFCGQLLERLAERA